MKEYFLNEGKETHPPPLPRGEPEMANLVSCLVERIRGKIS
jgi:hypothetical protein